MNTQGKKIPGREIRRDKSPEKEICLVYWEIAKKPVWVEQSGQREGGKGDEFGDVARGFGKNLGFYFKCDGSH